MKREYIKITDVSKTIKGKTILNKVSLSIKENEITGLIGINGSGKTMLLRAIAGLMKFKGEVTIDGYNVGDDAFAHDIGVLIETPGFLSEFSGKQNLQLLALLQENITEADIDESLESVGLNPEDRRTYRKYSLGMKERLGIAQAILKKPKLILLDEPTNGIDPDGIAQLKDLILSLNKEGCTFVIASHDRDFLSDLADETYTMKEGELICP